MNKKNLSQKIIMAAAGLSLFLTACGKETEEIQDDLQEGRQEVIIAAVETYEYDLNFINLEEFIQQFNESQSKYFVRLETISMEPSSTSIDSRPMATNDDFADAAQRLNIDLVTGMGGYDLFSAYAVRTLVQEGNISFVQKDENGQLIFDDKLLSDLLEYGKNAPLRQGEPGIKGVSVSLTASQDYRYQYTDPKTFIGFPTQDGQNGCFVENRRSLSICSNSDCKEGGWAFLEYYLLHNEDNRNTENSYYNNHDTYPAVKEIFEKSMADQLYSQYIRDENGEILLDEKGNPKLRTTSTGSNGFVYPPITEEDVAFVRDFLLSSRGAHLQLNTTNQLYVILSEEFVPYFADEKPLDEVVNIIKGRMLSYYQEQDI